MQPTDYQQILQRVVAGDMIHRTPGGKPIVVEAAFGPNMEPAGENSYGRTISDLFARLEKTGVEPSQVKWIVVEAGFGKRSERNKRRRANIPVSHFDRFGADGGDLAPDQQHRWEEQGTVIKRVPNDHDDIKRFRADIIAAFKEIVGDVPAARTVDGKQE